MKTEDGNDALHPWIEPELEARLTALVLGEASDFERDELGRLVTERPELALYQRRLEAMHRLLREVSTGESAEAQGEWKLAPERREALLARLGAEPGRNETVVPIPNPRSRSRLGMLIRIAACVAVVSLFLGLMWPASNGILRKVKSPADGAATFAYELPREEFSDRYGRSLRKDLEATKSDSSVGLSLTRTAGTESLAAVNLGDDFSVVTTTPARPGKAVELQPSTQEPSSNATSFFSGAEAFDSQGERVEDLRRGVRLSRAEPPTTRLPLLAEADADEDAETRGYRATTNEAALGDLEERELRELDRAARGSLPAPAQKELRDESPQEGEVAAVSVSNGGVALGLDFTAPPAAKPVAPASPPVSGPAVAGEALVEQEWVEKPADPLERKAEVVEFDGFIDLKEKKEAAKGAVAADAPAPVAAGRPLAETAPADGLAVSADKVSDGQGSLGGVGAMGAGGGVVSGGDFGLVPVPESAGLKDVEAGKREKVSQLERLSEFSNALANDGTNAAGRRGQEGKEQPMREAAAQAKQAEGQTLTWHFQGEAGTLSGSESRGAIQSDEIAQSVNDILALTPQVGQGQRPDLNASSGSGGAMRFGGEPADATEKGFGFENRYANGPAEGRSFSLSSALGSAPVATPSSDLLTQVYQVPPTFLSSATDENNIGDPFASPVSAGGSPAPAGRVTAKEILESAGISFPEGSTAIYNAETSQLIVRNTKDQIELVEALTDSLKSDVSEREVLVQSKFVVPAALGETSAETEPFSTFSLHVSDVSFQLAKAALGSGQWPEAEKIRIEEFVNAFDYGDPVPSMGERVACRIDQGAHPFLQQRNLVRIALRTAEAGRSSGTPLRLTLLLDSSGSMERPDRRETLTRAVATLAGLLGENDTVTLVSFARQPRLVADAAAGNEAMKLAETVAALPSEGGTNLEAALELAFEKAREHREPNAQNRIVLLTDGAANLGDAKAESLGARVEMMRESGIAFDAAGFGAEGLNDEILEALTRKGDGRYYLLDRPEDAEDAFAKQIAGALRPAAKNVKVQVEFNPDRVKSYKLLGFEKHRLATEDFRNDAVDAAELAAAEAGVAVYQVEPDPTGEGDLGSVSVRFRDLESGEMIERRWSLPHLATAPAPEQGGDAILLATVASQFAAILAGGPLGDVVDLGELARLAAQLPDSARVQELRTMIEQARGLAGGF